MSLDTRITDLAIAVGTDVKSIITSVSGKNTSINIKDDNTPVVSNPDTINFTGIGVSTTHVAGVVEVNVPGLVNETYIHTQSVSSNTWNIIHNLNSHPSVTIVDSSGDMVEGDLKYLSVNEIQLSFSAAFGGVAYLN